MPEMNEQANRLNRRQLLGVLSAAGLGHTLLPGVLWGMAAQASPEANSTPAGIDHDHLTAITPEMIDAAAAIAAIKLTDAQKKQVLEGLRTQRDSVLVIRSMKIPNSVPPAFIFDPVPAGMKLDTVRKPMRMSKAPKVESLVTAGENTLAFATVREQAELVKTRKLTSVALTKLYLERLRRYDPKLHFVITLTEDRALKQAAEADKEIAAGQYRGPLHGIPWGAKDLLAVKGYATTWGAAGFEQQSFDDDATVVERLDAAGAVLVAKLTMGALAQGDLWFGGRTRKPMEPEAGIERFFCRKRQRRLSRLRGLRHRDRDTGIDLLAEHPLRHHGAASDLRLRSAHRSHDTELDDGQDRRHLSLGGGLRPGDECYLRARRP